MALEKSGIFNFSKLKNKTQKDPTKVPKTQNSYKEQSNQKVLENWPPKVGILIKKLFFFKFSISKKTR